LNHSNAIRQNEFCPLCRTFFYYKYDLGCSMGSLFSCHFELFYKYIRLKISYLSEYFIAFGIKHYDCGFCRYAESHKLI
jgi:hypothetical protein